MLKSCKKDFGKPPNLRKQVLIKMGTAAYDARNRLAESSAEQDLEHQLSELEKYYEDLYLSGHSTR